MLPYNNEERNDLLRKVGLLYKQKTTARTYPTGDCVSTGSDLWIPVATIPLPSFEEIEVFVQENEYIVDKIKARRPRQYCGSIFGEPEVFIVYWLAKHKLHQLIDLDLCNQTELDSILSDLGISGTVILH